MAEPTVGSIQEIRYSNCDFTTTKSREELDAFLTIQPLMLKCDVIVAIIFSLTAKSDDFTVGFPHSDYLR
jgi:hypothetical protein